MSQEQRDSYVIPPNFIEGGSFFGGLFKARNVVEAVILAAGTGLPILTLSLTLTRMSSTRQKINLCKSRNPKLPTII